MNDYDGPVREYIRDCKRAAAELKLRRSHLDPKAHPTADGAVKLIFHNGDKSAAAQIRQAFREAAGGPS